MNQNIDQIINNLNQEWASDLSIAKSRIAFLTEENHRLKQEIEILKKGRENLDKEDPNAV